MQNRVLLLLAVAVLCVVVVQLPRLLERFMPFVRVRRALRDERRSRRAPVNTLDAYHVALPAAEVVDAIDDRTWRDLDLDDVFATLDHTRSRPGQHTLHHLLRTPLFEGEALAQLAEDVAAIGANDATRARFREVLGRVDDPRAGYLVNLLYGELPERPGYWWIFPVLAATSIASLALLFVWPKAIVAVIAIAAVGLFLQNTNRRHKALIPAIHELPTFLSAARTLGAIEFAPFAAQCATLRDDAEALAMLERTTRWLRFDPTQQSSDIIGSLYGYVNLLFLLDLNALVFSIKRIRAARPQLQRMYRAMGYIDSVQSIAAWRARLPVCCTPQFTAEAKQLVTTGLVHPLVTNPIPNDVTLDGTSALITGSNMSGKTTLVRALGVNAVLAQTLATVCATSWHAPLLAVATSIGRSDSVVEGRSYYLAEVESVGRLVKAACVDAGRQHLFLLDEIFRGTNTPERVAGAFAVLEHLNRNRHLVVVATHDVELLAMLGDAYAAHHFREQIDDGVLRFDFTMRPGVATTRNAIALLELLHYPASVVARAREVVGDSALPLPLTATDGELSNR